MPAVSELRQCGSIQLGQGSSSATARSYSTVIASSRPAALSGSSSTATHTSASRVSHRTSGAALDVVGDLGGLDQVVVEEPSCQRLEPLGRVAQERTGELDDEGVVPARPPASRRPSTGQGRVRRASGRRGRPLWMAHSLRTGLLR
jgi:hypothetical protein